MLELEAMLSSSLIDETDTVPSPLNANVELNFVADPIEIKLESPASIWSTVIVSLRSNVTPVPATVAVMESPERNSRSLVPIVSVAEFEEESDMPIVVTIDAVSESTYALIDCCVAKAVALLEDILSSSRIVLTELPLPKSRLPDIVTPPSILIVVESSARRVPLSNKSSDMDIPVESCEDILFTSRTFTLSVPDTFRSSCT